MQPPDLLAFVRSNLRAIGPKEWPAIAEATGKPLSTLRKIAYGDRKNPKLDTIEPIANHLRERLPQ
jgi:predicted transcriptional regulator